MWNDTICAISTALQKGAVAIVRMSGEESFSVAEKILDLPKEKMQPNSIHYCHVRDGEEVLDEVLVSFFRAPHSYTAEDMVEINCHGGVYVTRRVLSLLLKKGCRPAEPGDSPAGPISTDASI